MTETAAVPTAAGSSVSACPVCASPTQLFFTAADLPVHVGVLWADADSAKRAQKGPVGLAFCRACGLVHNPFFDPLLLDYGQEYDNSLHASGVFREFEVALAERLITRYDLRNASVVEVGSGGGHFLSVVCDRGDNVGTGFDPSFSTGQLEAESGGRVTIVRDEYSPGAFSGPIDLLCCRQVLEHIPDPMAFLETLRSGAGPGTIIYLEVPNSRMLLEGLSVWDIVYEHCLYFTDESFRFAVEAAGFDVIEARDDYEGQLLGLDLRRGDRVPSPPDLGRLGDLVSSFAQQYGQRVAAWTDRLEEMFEEGRVIAAWGGGARAIGFLNMLDVAEGISCVVDLNERKQGTHIAGTGQPIVAPLYLRELRPDVVIVFNAIYLDEITAALHEMDLDPEVLAA